MESALNTNCNIFIIKDNPESRLKNSFNWVFLTELKWHHFELSYYAKMC